MTENLKNSAGNSQIVNTPPSDEKKPSFFEKLGANIKEWARKRIVRLKSRPNKIPMFFVVVCMLVYLLSMNDFSHTNLGLDVKNGGLMSFWSTLLSILSCVLYMNAYPKRQKTKYAMLILTFVFLAILVVLDVYYIKGIDAQLAKGIYDESNYIDYFHSARSVCNIHMVLLAITILLCATLPLYTKLLRKIDTSVKLEQSQLEKIDTLEDIEE